MFNNSSKRLAQFFTQRSASAATAANIVVKTAEANAQEMAQMPERQHVDPRNVECIDLSLFKILIAEDNLINQKVLQKMLQKMKASCKVVSSGAEALEALRNDYFDIVLMDCYMPEMSGFEAAAAIRASQERFSRIPIIACSAGLFDDEVKSSLQAGMNDFLPKPVSYDLLRKKIQEWAYRVFEGLSVLDINSLDKIRVFDDQHQTLLRSLYQIYSENTQDELYKLRDLILDGQQELIRKKAHMLKSSAAQLGAFRFEKFCILMEHEENLDITRAKVLYDGMCAEYENSRIRFLEYCQNLSQISNVLM